jgi:hypothetical protein
MTQEKDEAREQFITEANELLRELNAASVFEAEIDMERLPIGVGIVEEAFKRIEEAGRLAGLEQAARLVEDAMLRQGGDAYLKLIAKAIREAEGVSNGKH